MNIETIYCDHVPYRYVRILCGYDSRFLPSTEIHDDDIFYSTKILCKLVSIMQCFACLISCATTYDFFVALSCSSLDKTSLAVIGLGQQQAHTILTVRVVILNIFATCVHNILSCERRDRTVWHTSEMVARCHCSLQLVCSSHDVRSLTSCHWVL